ncbi:MAG: hypothetical protein AABY73_00900 [Pseudomonadota bacterium]
MPGNHNFPRNQMRERIAQLAARLMAADGVQDFALAKRKAARQLGADDTQNLPNNTEIEQALRDYHELYQRDEQRVRVREMRHQALAAMREFAPFDPPLTGAVLAGTATRYSNISLMLFTDSPKEVELYLLNRNIPFRCGEKHYSFGDKLRSVPILMITGGEHEGVDAAIFSTVDLRNVPRHAGDGRPLDKARRPEVEALLEADS